MKHSIIFSLIVFGLFGGSYAQQVRNVDFTVKGEEIHITYDLEQNENQSSIDYFMDVELYYSMDKGSSWYGPLNKHVSGEIGETETGENKTIIWKPLKSMSCLYSDYVSFRVKVKEKRNGTFTDSRDGKTYKCVKIGDQVWMAENLNYKISSGSWCYDDKSSNCNKYGRLYNWETAKKVCPAGWHLPSKSEFETLLNNVGGAGSVAYYALKSGGSSGFSALFGGWRRYDGGCSYIGQNGHFWSSSPYNDGSAGSLSVSSKYEYAYMSSDYRYIGNSVRCLQDE